VRGEGQPEWKISRPDGSLPAPPHDSSGHTWHHADAELLEIITKGGVIYMPESQMPGYGDRLTQDEIGLVLAWIKTLWGPQEHAAQADRTASWQEMYGNVPDS
jgi:mono/diheme cytochrome c family protein